MSPSGALDLKLRQQIQLEIKQLQSEVGITFIYVTHDQDEALAMSDRIVVMRGGRIEQVGTPRQIYNDARRPDSSRRSSAKRIFSRGKRSRQGDTAAPSNGTVARSRRRARRARVSNGSNVAMIVRPEDIRLCPSSK